MDPTGILSEIQALCIFIKDNHCSHHKEDQKKKCSGGRKFLTFWSKEKRFTFIQFFLLLTAFYSLCLVILLDMGSHAKRRPCTGGIGKGKETKNLNVVDMLTV
jgi:hypothetical protein